MMEPFDPLDPAAHDRWDADAASGENIGIDPWCSRPTWALAVNGAFSTDADPGPPIGLESELGQAVFASLRADDGTTVLAPLDRVWGFGSCIIPSRDAPTRDLLDDTVAALLARSDWRICALSGMVEHSPIDEAVVEAFGRHLPLYAGASRTRCQASLAGGVDGYLSRRAREHRRNVRQAERRANSAGVIYDVADDHPPERMIRRLHAVETESWKGREGSGIEANEMARLYERLIGDLGRRNAVRCVFAQLPSGADVGFILGGVLGDTYRGLQVSFIEESRGLSVGNLLQWHEVQRMCTENLRTYDLGMDIDYKRRWAENEMTTRTVFAVRR